MTIGCVMGAVDGSLGYHDLSLITRAADRILVLRA
jgi:hypothetical protein